MTKNELTAHSNCGRRTSSRSLHRKHLRGGGFDTHKASVL